MKLTVVLSEKKKTLSYAEGVNEYEKRLRSYCKLNFIDPPFRMRQFVSAKKTLCLWIHPEGKSLRSPDLADLIAHGNVSGVADCFLFVDVSRETFFETNPSCSLALDSKEVEHRDIRLSSLSLSPSLYRLLLTEQIYRAYRIIHRHPYHK